MRNIDKSKLTVIGFVVFVLTIYTASYFYTKDKNEQLLSSPRLVMLIGSENIVNKDFATLSAEQRRSDMRTFFQLGRAFSISQQQYDGGLTDISDYYKDRISNQPFIVEDCLDYSERLKRTMEVVAKSQMKSSWVFAACGIIE